jgi:SAM-dependent methyltransferase
MEVLQIPSELEQALALHAKVKPRRVLEIGCWDGGTLREWLTAKPAPELVVAVSLEHRQPEIYPQWTHPKTNLVVGTGNSLSPEMVEIMQTNAPYDWAFIDGEHDYDYVNHDVAVVLPLIREGGVMLLHDVTPDLANEVVGAAQVFAQLQDAGYQTDLYDSEPQPWSAGIGVVHVP